jgi:circadian clock protein KaiC
MDTWILLRDIESNGERNRGMYILKSRGTAHSNQIREFQVTNKGIRLVKAYLGPEGVLTGSARLAQERRERDLQLRQAAEARQRQEQTARKLQAIEAQIAMLKSDADALATQAQIEREQAEADIQRMSSDTAAMAASRRIEIKTNGQSNGETQSPTASTRRQHA